MAFKGDLKNISLFDVFQTLNTNNQTGVLVLQREGVTKKVHISPAGVRVFFSRSFRPLRLGEIFIRRGLITSQDVEILLLQQKQEYRPIGELLVASGKVSKEQIDQVLRYQAEDEVYEIFAWDSGTFAFFDGASAGEHANNPLSEVLLDSSGLCLEAARRLDEMERLRKVIPSNGEYFAQAEGFEPDRAANSASVCAVYDALAAPNSVDDLRDLVGLSLFDILRTLVCLLEGGLIRPLDGEELIATAALAKDQGNHERAAQLYEKAHRRDPKNRAVLEECVRAVQRLGEPPRLAHHLAALGRLCVEEGDPEKAVEHLEQALRHQSDNYEALGALRDAFMGQGQPESAAETSLRIARAYSENGDLEQAIGACRAGLEIVPDSVSLRYYLGQILMRVDRPSEAREELLTLVRETETNKKVMRSRKAHELLTGCFRLLLKINPQDEEAHEGLRNLDRMLLSSKRRRTLAVRGAIAAALLCVAAGVGLAFRGASPEQLFAAVVRAQQSRDESAVREAIETLLDHHPESEEALRATRIRRQMDLSRQQREQEQRKREDLLRSEFVEQWEGTRNALAEGPPADAIAQVEAFLERLRKPEAAFLRSTMQPHVEYGLLTFLDRIAARFDADRGEVAVTEQKLKANADRGAAMLLDLENRLSGVRRWAWPTLLPQLIARLDEIGKSPAVGRAQEGIAEFRKRIEGSLAAFDNLDALFFTVRRERLRAEIEDTCDSARKRGLMHESSCEFAEARALYDAAFRKADSATDEEPRPYFRDLLQWIDQRRFREDMKYRRDQMDAIVRQLALFERERSEGREDAAFRIMRDLRRVHRVPQFEGRYKFPYRIDSTPRGAEVTLDGKVVGTTPMAVELEMSPRPVFVRISKPGFESADVRLEPMDPNLTGLLDASLPKRTVWEKEIAGGTEAAPVIHGGLALVASANTSLLAFHLSDGELAWEAKTKDLERIKVAPVVCGGHACFITGAGRLFRVNLADGKPAGRTDLPGQVLFDVAADGDRLFVATRERHLICLKGSEIVWSKQLAAAPSTRVLLARGRLFIGTAEGSILVHDAKSGAQIAVTASPSGSSFFGGIEACGGLVLAGAEDGALYAFDGERGLYRWRFNTPGPVTTQAVASADGTSIYLATRAGHVSVLSPDGEEQEAAFELPGIAPDAPVLANGFLYAIGSNRLSAFDSRELKSWWDFTFPKDEFPVRLAAGDGHLAVVTSKHRLVLFSLDRR